MDMSDTGAGPVSASYHVTKLAVQKMDQKII